ncbi:hypothetical protein SK128_023960 [Halocaridina rubra]|uniref:CHK kinase-like domain-containing protein n=1 Tax=Halocaridina rubra TaxID=373956 RepID=A0AAN8XJU9_HALRR
MSRVSVAKYLTLNVIWACRESYNYLHEGALINIHLDTNDCAIFSNQSSAHTQHRQFSCVLPALEIKTALPRTTRRLNKMDDASACLTDNEICLALKADKSHEAKLISWTMEDVSSQTDGATSNIKNITIKYYSSEKQEQEVYYILKVHSSRGELYDIFLNTIYMKESKFYAEVIPALNAVLKEIGSTPLSFPKCFYYNIEKGRDMIILENLKQQDYKMESRALGISAAHATLVLKELAKLHAASFLLQAKTPNHDLVDKFECLQKEWTKEFKVGVDFGQFVDGYLKIGIAMFKKFGNCEKIVNWIEKIRPNAWKMYDEMLVRKPPFDLILHGDCWINNILFSYDERNSPVDVKLFDLQGCRIGSLALDLQHFLNLNLTGPERRPNLPFLLAIYHKTFCDIVEAGGVTMPFTLEELREEYVSKGYYGALYAIMWLPNMVRRPEDAQDVLDVNTGAKLSELENVLRMVDNNPLLKPRIMSVMEEWMEYGVIS